MFIQRDVVKKKKKRIDEFKWNTKRRSRNEKQAENEREQTQKEQTANSKMVDLNSSVVVLH